jgi:predicted metal-dependent HD superfamily phosphohydrolase
MHDIFAPTHFHMVTERPAQAFADLKAKLRVLPIHADAVHDMLSSRDRLYHNCWHIASMYDLHRQLSARFVPDLADDPVILHGIYYHDAVYDASPQCRLGDNERASAALWREHAQIYWGYPLPPVIDPANPALQHQIDRLILETEAAILATATPIDHREYDERREWLVGLELASLAFSHDLFEFNTKLLRLEHHRLTDHEWEARNDGFLHKLRDHGGPIFQHPVLREMFEAKACANLGRRQPALSHAIPQTPESGNNVEEPGLSLREQLIDARARKLWLEFTSTTDNPKDWPNWDGLLAQYQQSQQSQNRVDDFRKIAENDLCEEGKIR